jgi:fructan beta-fructosidase
LLKLREPAPRQFAGGTFAEAATWLARQTNLPALLDVEMNFTGLDANSVFNLQLHTGADESTTISCDAARSRLTIDRTHSGQTGFHPNFAGRQEAPLRIADGRCTIRLMVDASSLEIFAQGGATVLTDLIFPASGARTLSIQSDGSAPIVGGIAIHTLKSAR